MDRLLLMTVFVAVAEEESFAGGGRRLSMSPPAVSRAIAALEDRLGVKLLERTTRHVRVTAVGQRYLEDARRIITECDEADEAAAGINAAPRGLLTVTAPVLFGRRFVTPAIVRYLAQHPETEVSALFIDRVVNLVEEGMDVAVRIGPLPDSSLRAIRVGEVRRVLCASPDYLARHGTPASPAGLHDHTLIAATSLTPGPEWHFGRDGRQTSVRLRPRLTVSSNDAAIAAAVEGFGITRVLSYQVADEVARGALRILLPEDEIAPLPVHLLHRETRHGSARVRAFIDLAVAMLRADPALNPPG